ncbi:MAG: GspE/PulE family protein [Candidatus Liptonbacteria bacterium]|nr:GspE/PulE family protein [Candidatus Liptonbacteria bacterium]
MLQVPNDILKDSLVKEGFIDSVLFDSLAFESQRFNQKMTDILVSRNIVTTSYLINFFSRHFNVPLADLGLRGLDENVLKLVSEDIARQKRVILFGREPDNSFSAAMGDPTDLETIEFLEKNLKSKIKPYLASEDDLNKGFAVYGKKLAEEFRKTIEVNIFESLRSGKWGTEAATEVPIVAIIDNLIAYAFYLKSSDIHLEIFEDAIFVRYRIDGMLREIMRISKEVHSALAARIKLLAGLRIDEHFRPQDGRFRHKIGGTDILDIRVAVIPTYYGEKVEMRLLTAAQRPLSLEELGMFEDTSKIIKENISQSHGIILVCGPTGSGKTTTMYSLLSILNRPEVNIVTIEDPIEYDIKYVNQTQINPATGVTFASGLRAIVRQDPDIIMVGEIRDKETADISIQSALTGHLVLSSLHTNNAVATIPRLLDMDIQNYLVAAVLRAILAQRLVRKICANCIYSIKPSEEIMEIVFQQMKESGLEKKFKPLKLIYEGKGCSTCGETGYKGRMGIFEAVNISEELRKIIISRDFSLDVLKKKAQQEGMITMFEDGIRKVEIGLTTIDEILRVIKE